MPPPAVTNVMQILEGRGFTRWEAVALLLPVLGEAYREVATEANESPDDLWGDTPGEALRTFGAAFAKSADDIDPQDTAPATGTPVVGAAARYLAAEKRIQAVTEATILWRDRPGGDVGLAIALAGILDSEQPDPPAAIALVRVLAECDRIEREVYGQHDEDDDGMREAVRRVRAAAGGEA